MATLAILVLLSGVAAIVFSGAMANFQVGVTVFDDNIADGLSDPSGNEWYFVDTDGIDGDDDRIVDSDAALMVTPL